MCIKYIIFFMLVSLYVFLKYEKLKWQLFGSIILGLSIVLKPQPLLLIPFLIVINYDLNRRRLIFDFFKSIIRIFGVIFPISLNIIIFLLYPKLWDGFLCQGGKRRPHFLGGFTSQYFFAPAILPKCLYQTGKEL